MTPTPKEKAIQLIEEFEPYSDYAECDVFTERENMRKNAKNCANICVDAILEAYNPLEYYPEDLRDYWENVRKEIEQL